MSCADWCNPQGGGGTADAVCFYNLTKGKQQLCCRHPATCLHPLHPALRQRLLASLPSSLALKSPHSLLLPLKGKGQSVSTRVHAMQISSIHDRLQRRAGRSLEAVRHACRWRPKTGVRTLARILTGCVQSQKGGIAQHAQFGRQHIITLESLQSMGCTSHLTC